MLREAEKSVVTNVATHVRTPHMLETRFPGSRVYQRQIAELLFEKTQFSMGTYEHASTSSVGVVVLGVTHASLTMGHHCIVSNGLYIEDVFIKHK